MKKLHIGSDRFALDASVAEDVIAILGRRGRGKTNTAVVLVEELHAAGARFCVADPVGVWWGLKSSKDGRSAGIPVVVMGGDPERRDVPLEEAAGRVIADFVADPSSPSVVLNFRSFRKAQMARFMADFLEQLYQRNREPLHLVLDEADQFAPQRVMGETARLVGAAEDVCKMGRARGLHPIVITQRPAALNKNVLTQAGLLVCHQLTGPQDQKAVDEWIRANADEEGRAGFLASIPELARGEAWFWQPDLPIFERVHVRERKTFDSSATPKRGEERKGPRVLAEVDLEALKKQIASTIEKAKAEDPRELRKQLVQQAKTIATLEEQLLRKPAAAAPTATREKLVLREAQIERLVATCDRLHVAYGALVDDLAARVGGPVQKIANEMKAALAAIRVQAGGAHGAVSAAAGAGRSSEGAKRPAALPGREHRPAPVVNGEGDASVGSGGLRRILVALAQRPQGLTTSQIGVRASLSSKSGTFDTYLSRARKAGWVTGERHGLRITEAGLAALGSYEPLPTGRALLTHWLRELGSGGAARILQALADAYPNELSRNDVAQAANLTGNSGTFDTYVSRLRSLELISGRGALKASDELFD